MIIDDLIKRQQLESGAAPAPQFHPISSIPQAPETYIAHPYTLLDAYTPGQQTVERGFRFLKDPWFMANTLFLKSPKRTMALIMTVCLLVYGALEYLSCQRPDSINKPFPARSAP